MLPYQYETNIFMPNLKRKKINWDYGKQRTILLHGNGENTPEKVTGKTKNKYLISEFWTCRNTRKRSSQNTLWCLLVCTHGDFGTIYQFQITDHTYNTIQVMGLATVNGVLTSIFLEMFDFLIVGEAKLTIISIPFMLKAGLLTPLPYNYYRLNTYGQPCHSVPIYRHHFQYQKKKAKAEQLLTGVFT